MQQKYPPQNDVRLIRYFVEGKLVFAVEISGDGEQNLREAVRESLQDKMPGFVQEQLGLDGYQVNLSHIAIFDQPAANPDTVETTAQHAVDVVVTVEVENLDDNELIERVQFFQSQVRENGGRIELPLETLSAYVTAASPDWLAAIAAEQDGTGGPGGRPVAGLESDGDAAHEFIPASVIGNDILQEILATECADGAEVDIAILDTAPSQCVLQDAYRFWGPSGGGKEHPLINELLAPNRLTFDENDIANKDFRLWVCYANPTNYPGNPTMAALNNPVTFNRTSYGRIVEHPYRMPDHGLFVAGIAHRFAPKARLFLIQVMNDWGICSIESIVAGLEKLREVRARQGRSGKPLVINLSLCLALPRVSAHQALDPAHSPVWPEQRFDREFYLDMLALFQKLTGIISNDPNAIIVAAAGNDQLKNPGDPPEARFPAAFSNVIGVGALGSLKTKPGSDKVEAGYASYSNLADEPPNEGYITFGGSIAHGYPPEHAQTDKHGGILGIYTGDFPDGTVNRTGWARWAGTSFATPIIAGLLAKQLCGRAGVSINAAISELNNSLTEVSSSDANVVAMRHVS